MKQYIVDAFADKVFEGNPAAICMIDSWLPDEIMLKIAKENNLSETAFVLKDGLNYQLRWFTPGGEIDLCGHATLASAYVIFRFYEPEVLELSFDTLSGILKVVKNGDIYEMDFPAYELKKTDVTKEMEDALGAKVLEAYIGRDLLCLLESEDHVRNLKPNQDKLKSLDGLLQHVTAKAKDFDCVSRSFAPKLSIAEDPVCGSGHCHIVPYWANKLGKDNILAYQASERGGSLYCRYEGDRVILGGKAVLFSEGRIFV